MSVTGEMGWSSAGKTPVRMTFEPVPKGDYELQLQGLSTEIKVGKDSDMPYINVRFNILGTAKEGGKDRAVFKKFWLGVRARAGKSMAPVDAADQLLGFVKAIGEEPSFTGDQCKMVTATDDNGEKYEQMIIDPLVAKAWFQERDGITAKAHLKVRPERKENGTTYEASNEIAYFIEADV